jgi:hypothetical protein
MVMLDMPLVSLQIWTEDEEVVVAADDLLVQHVSTVVVHEVLDQTMQAHEQVQMGMTLYSNKL